jgi:cellulose synthase/poly-beta-1,6-N-acetylglucosamine synthase-like glycosyltransferase
VAERVLEAAARLDYPSDRLEIQVLDDSTDDTPERVARAIERLRARGVKIAHLRRSHREGFKAGALAAGLRVARGELVAIFDADFVPPPDFALRLVGFFADPRVGMVQARWGHLNEGDSALTRVQALLLDGHFLVEQFARHRAGLWFNFNGTAGIWRRKAIEEAGGWQADTLSEDLDLSYRAQLAGWRFVYVPEVVVPAELPADLDSFKSQQHRWAKGAIETARKLLGEILRAPLPLRKKAEAFFHLTAHGGYPLLLLLAVLTGPALWLRQGLSSWTVAAVDLPLFALALVSVVVFYAVVQREATGRSLWDLRWVFVLMAIGIGLSVTASRAVLEGWLGRGTREFKRTPKHGVSRRATRQGSARSARVGPDAWIEAVLASYFGILAFAATRAGLWGSLPFLLLFGAGFAYTATRSLFEAVGQNRLNVS